MTARRLKLALIAGMLAVSGLALLTWTQEWFSIVLADGVRSSAGSAGALAVNGQVAAPGLSALSLAGLALGAALGIAGPVFRVILGVLAVVLGFCVVLSGFLAVTNPVGASASVITDATGVAGAASVADLVGSVTASAWPAVALAAGLLMAATGVVVILTNRRWPGPSRKYQATRFEATDGESKQDAVDSWDELSRGDDPTR